MKQNIKFLIRAIISVTFITYSTLSCGAFSDRNPTSQLSINKDNLDQKTTLEQAKDNTIKGTLTWFTTGKLDPNFLADNFLFKSPYYKGENKTAFIKEFKDSTFYKDKVLSKINRFDPLITLKSTDGNYFAIITQYHTYSGHNVFETVLGKFNNDGLLVELRSIYDLDETKKAFQLK